MSWDCQWHCEDVKWSSRKQPHAHYFLSLERDNFSVKLPNNMVFSFYCKNSWIFQKCRHYGNLLCGENFQLNLDFYGKNVPSLWKFERRKKLFWRFFLKKNFFILMPLWALYWFSFLSCLQLPSLHLPPTLIVIMFLVCVCLDEKQHQNSPFQLNKEVPAL